jgi:hypothetical protein
VIARSGLGCAWEKNRFPKVVFDTVSKIDFQIGLVPMMYQRQPQFRNAIQPVFLFV